MPFLVMLSFCYIGIIASLESALCLSSFEYYETFNYISEFTRVKRSFGQTQLVKRVHFHVFNISFDLTLESGATVLARNFKTYLVNGYGKMRPFTIDTATVFTGHRTDNSSIIVSAHTEDVLWSIQVFEVNNIYVIEPAWYYLTADSNPKNNTYLAYRASDLKNVTWKCLNKYANQSKTFKTLYSMPDKAAGHFAELKKRSTKGTTCLMNMFADYDLFARRCRHSEQICGSLIVSLVQKADAIYRASVFDYEKNIMFTNISLHIKNLYIYTSYTISDPNGGKFVHFNVDGIAWTADDKLNSFAYYMLYMHPKLCLNHLVTSFPFPQKVLGLAYTGGICKVMSEDHFVMNTALISTMSSSQEQVSSLEVLLAFAHGHNFGSDHDPNKYPCSQSEANGGNYIMWAYSGTGKYTNNFRFSPCSLKSIGRTIANADCFVEDFDKSLCGNGLPEDTEECDPGLILNNDPCCTSDCQLKQGAICSDKHQQCCSSCRVASNQTMCSDTEYWSCKQRTYCTGDSLECPQALPLPNFTTCLDGGQCFNGVCVGYCEAKGQYEKVSLRSCLCKTPEFACKWCCYDDSDPDKQCKPHSNSSVLDGRRCYLGYCYSGVCEPIYTSPFMKVFNYILSLPKMDAARVILNNLVIIIAAVSLCLWIPCTVVFFRMFKNEDWTDSLVLKIVKPLSIAKVFPFI
ncbi:ADAM 17-like protease isoform X2 [Biomphalaria glabrata]